MKEIKIADKIIGEGNPCFIIAEAGVNHNGNLDLAKKLVDVAVEAGTDAVKFQTFKAENVVTKNADMAVYQEKNIGVVESQQEMLKKLELKYEDFIELKKYCDEKGIVFLSTPHSEDAVDFLDDLVPAYKIGSGDLNNTPLLRKIAGKGKPMILGTGMATLEEIKGALEAIKHEGNDQVVMLHCTTNYPCPLEEVNLRAMQTMQEELDCLMGYSDHTMGIQVPVMAATLDATIIEKHFTLDRNLPGPDHKASLEPQELKEMVKQIKLVRLIKGNPEKKPNKSEESMIKTIRKSVVAVQNIPKNTTITKEMLIIKRPGIGIYPFKIDEIIGKVTKKDVSKDELINWGDLE